VCAPEVSHYLVNRRVVWKFIVDRTGGFWERMVQSVKRSLRKCIGLYFDELNTLLIEVESVINLRSLTYIHDDTEGTSYPLCPSASYFIYNAPSNSYLNYASSLMAQFCGIQHQSLVLQLPVHRLTSYHQRC